MSSPKHPPPPKRYIGLDIHKNFLVAVGVDRNENQVFGPHKVYWPDFEGWIGRHLRPDDEVVIEMTTNTWLVHDTLEGKVAKITVVHPPHIKLITQAEVMTDKIAATRLAKLLARGHLPSVWVPPQEVRELRALVAQRRKMIQLQTKAKSRLQTILHRYHLKAPEGHAFADKNRSFWEELPLTVTEAVILRSDLATLDFAKGQIEAIEAELSRLAAQDERVPLLIQLPGVGVILAMVILASIGDIGRFPNHTRLVGYAGLHGKVHSSGESGWSGGLVNRGGRDLRWAMVQVGMAAAKSHPHWKEKHRQIAARRNKYRAKVAIGRRILISVWHVLTKHELDRFAIPEKLAAKFFAHAYKIGISNLPDGMSAREYVRYCLDVLGTGKKLDHFMYGKKKVNLPERVGA